MCLLNRSNSEHQRIVLERMKATAQAAEREARKAVDQRQHLPPQRQRQHPPALQPPTATPSAGSSNDHLAPPQLPAPSAAALQAVTPSPDQGRRLQGEWSQQQANQQQAFIDIQTRRIVAVEEAANAARRAAVAGGTIIVVQPSGAQATVDQLMKLCDAGKARFVEGKIKAFENDGTRVTSVTVAQNDGEDVDLPADALMAFFGLAPKLGPIAEWGLDLNRKTVNVDTEKFETNIPGVFAIGDINYYPGKKKLILSGFHEAALAAFAAKAIIEPGKKVHLQYTTTSPKMHERLGVESDN